MIAEEVKNELYSFDDNHWSTILENIFKILHFPIKLNYTSDWEEFIYVHSERLRYLSPTDKKILQECDSIAAFSLNGKFRGIKAFGIKISGNKKLRNEKTAEIHKLFRKMYGRHIFFGVFFEGDIAFVGTSYDKNKGSETIISDWFGYETNNEIFDRIEEIDFSNYSDESLGQLYEDYLWAIARPYIKYRESKIFLIFGCGYIETYDSFAQNMDGQCVSVRKIDREKTLQVNSSYYPDLYGDDYFIDDSGKADDPIDIFDEDDVEFEWTMLEMDLAQEKEFAEDDYDKIERVEESTNNIDENGLSEMNPEEMLNYIKNS